MSLVLKRSLWSNWDALGRIEGSELVSRLIYLAKIGQLLDSVLGILLWRSSPSVCARSISVPNGWNNSNAITPILYISDCINETKTEHQVLLPHFYDVPKQSNIEVQHIKQQKWLQFQFTVPYLWIIVRTLKLFWGSVNKSSYSTSVSWVWKVW